MSENAQLPMAGILVLALEQAIAAPFDVYMPE